MIGLLIPSFFWFFRAFLSTGNPLHPISIQFSQWMIPIPIRPDYMMPSEYADTKYVRSILEWFIYPWVEYQKGGTFSYNPGSGVGAAFATLITVCVINSLFSVIKNWRRRNNRLNLALFSGFVVMLVLWWFVLDRVPRFMIPALALACGLSAPTLAMLIRANSLIFRALVLSSVSITCALLIALPSYQFYERTKYGFWQRSSEYHYPPIIDKLPEGSVIWNRGHELHNFPLAGDRLSNKVIPRYWGEYGTAHELLKKEKVDYIATSGGISCDDCSSYGSLIYQDKMSESSKIYHNWLIWKVEPNP
jgi:hypothetical protein